MTSEDGLIYADDVAAELGATGAGAAEEAGTSGEGLGVGAGDGMTVVNDVTIITGGICNDADGETLAGVLDGDVMDSSAKLDEVGTPSMSEVDDTREADSWASVAEGVA